MEEDERLSVLTDAGMTLEEAYRQLQKIDLLIEQMKHGVAEFEFTKKDGSLRVAHGTLQVSEEEYQFKGAGKSSIKTVPFWDCDKGAWRSFSLASLV